MYQVGQLIFLRLIGRRHRQHAALKVVGDDAHHSRRIDGLRRQLRARGQELLAQRLHEVALLVGRLDQADAQHRRQRAMSLQAKTTAACDEERAGKRGEPEAACVHTTRFRSLPGTNMTLRSGLSPTNFITCSSASAASRAAASSALTEMLTRPRSLPFTCTTISSVSCTSAASSTIGHGPLSSSPKLSRYPSAPQSSWVMCGTTGYK